MNNKLDTSQLLPVGTILHGTYRVDEYLASGGFGNTYLVTDIALEKQFAVKEFFYRDICNRDADSKSVSVGVTSNEAQYSALRAKFKKEAQRISRLDDRHIVKVQALFDENNTSYYVMDYIKGQSLANLLEQSGPIDESTALGYFNQMLDALEVVHAAKLLHLDIKPANIMIDSKGNVVLIDFGSSKNTDVDGEATTNSKTGFCLTRSFSPIELSSPDPDYSNIGAWTDIYELGATLFNILTNQTPPSSDAIMANEDGAFNFPPSINNHTRDLVMKMMTPGRKHRPQNIQTVKSLLGEQAEPIPVRKRKTKPIPASANQEKTVIKNLPAQSRKELSPVIQNLINNMVKVKGGTFWMGGDWVTLTRKGRGWFSGSETYKGYDSDCSSDETPRHVVTLSSFSIGRFAVTQQEWHAVMGNYPSKVISSDHPVENVSWNDCQEFINKLNELTGLKFRLPTEAEWEFAARGGNQSLGYKYSGSNSLADVGWYSRNSGNTTKPVGKKAPNELGLYDMSGNIHEWCQDWYGNYSNESQTNPTGPAFGTYRVARGGSWNYGAGRCRVSYRCNSNPTHINNCIGFRLAL